MKNTEIKGEIFSERLKEIIDENNEKIYTIADKTGLDKSTISRYTNNKAVPKKTFIEVIARKFNVNPGWLMGYNVPKKLNNFKTQNYELTNNEKEIIDLYRELDSENKVKAKWKFEGIIETLLDEQEEKRDIV